MRKVPWYDIRTVTYKYVGIIHPDSHLQVLVTGANGFLGSHIVDQFLAQRYKVRGTVRDLDKNKWLQEYFDNKYGSGKLELVKVQDFTTEHCFDEAVRGVAKETIYIYTRLRSD